MMEELIRVLENTVSGQQSNQNEAISYIQQYIERDHSGFLKALSDALYNQQNSPVVRTAAGLQLKNQLSARDETLRLRQQEQWRSLPDDCRKYIKERVFQTLGTEIFRPSSASQCLAYIALIELPEGRWPGLIQALTQNVTNPQSAAPVRLASLEAIGYICQDIDQSRIQPSDLDSILTAIVGIGMRQEECDEVKLAATNALVNLSKNKIYKIASTQQKISFDDLGQYLNIRPDCAERMVAQMIRDDKLKGHLDQIDRHVYFEAEDVLQKFDENIVSLCSEVNSVVERIRSVVPDEWWVVNAHQPES